jgi:PPOX class probable F420-dependent enzyme
MVAASTTLSPFLLVLRVNGDNVGATSFEVPPPLSLGISVMFTQRYKCVNSHFFSASPACAYVDCMELNSALGFAAMSRNALLTTLRSDGRPQQSVIFYVADENRFTISLTATRAKTKNLQRDPRATLFIWSDNVFQWVSLDGTVELSPVAQSPSDEVVDLLVEHYRLGNGEHPDWDRFRTAMVNDERLLATFTATSATGILPD